MTDYDRYRLSVRGRLSIHRETVKTVQSLAAAAPRWIPARGLLAQCRLALDLLDGLQERLDRKLVVTLIGPSGAGKSTLLNALAGDDRLSETGIHRPTTSAVVVYCRSENDADLLRADPALGRVVVRTAAAAPRLDHLVLVDTPDMDSSESLRFHPLLAAAIAHTDILICVLNAENPKRRDTIVFLKAFVELYPGSLLLVVLNRCDRLREAELKTDIVPDVRRHLESAWQKRVENVFCISARRHLRDPQWPEDERPLHAFDEYDRLRQLIFEDRDHGSHFVDARGQRGEHLATLVRTAARTAVKESAAGLEEVRQAIAGLERRAATDAVAELKVSGAETVSGVQAMFHQKLAGRWWGPVGWLLAAWSRFLTAGVGLAAALRFGNPVVQLWGLVSALARYRKTRAAMEEAATGGGLEPVLLRYRYTIQQEWPDIAGRLVALGFNESVRDVAIALPDEAGLRRRLADAWGDSLETVMERRAAGISGFLLQLVFNLPTLALMGRFAYDSVTGFLLGRTLASGYFLHAAVSIVLVWLLSFVLLQVVIRLAGGRHILKRAFDELLKRIDGDARDPVNRSILAEIDAVLRLGGGSL